MTKEQYHLTQMKEELLEVAAACIAAAQACSKAVRFGLDDTWPGRDIHNAENITKELNDVYGALDELNRFGAEHDPNWKEIGLADQKLISEKIAKIQHWMNYAEKKGQVTP